MQVIWMTLFVLPLLTTRLSKSQLTTDREFVKSCSELDDRQSITRTLSDVVSTLRVIAEKTDRLKHSVDLLRQETSSNGHCCVPNSTNRPTTRAVSMRTQRDCADILSDSPGSPSGVYSIVIGQQSQPVKVYCDMTTAGGGWTIFQRRKDGSINFYRPWKDYADGFGNLHGEFWLGNDNLHGLTSSKDYVLRIDMTDWDGNSRYAEYSHFVIAESSLKYKLASLGQHTGNAGDSLTYATSAPFSTYDQDNDSSEANCAILYHGAWWYTACHSSNLNGDYRIGGNSSYAVSVVWQYWKGYYYSLKTVEMKIRAFVPIPQ